MLPWSILQYFRPSLSYHLALRPLFCLIFSGRLGQVLLYTKLWTAKKRYCTRLQLSNNGNVFCSLEHDCYCTPNCLFTLKFNQRWTVTLPVITSTNAAAMLPTMRLPRYVIVFIVLPWVVRMYVDYLTYRWTTMVELFYSTYISVDIAHYEKFSW